MATNDNRAMVEAAETYLGETDLDYENATAEIMAYFALEQIALAVAAERTRIGDELEAILSAKLDRGDWLANIWTYIDKLRAECDADR